MSVTTKQPKSSQIYTPAIVQHLQEFSFLCKVIPSVGAALGVQRLAKTPAMECAPKAAPTNKTEYIYTWAATLSGYRAIKILFK